MKLKNSILAGCVVLLSAASCTQRAADWKLILSKAAANL